MSVWKNIATKSVQELRFLYCGTAEHSAGIRTFIQKHYPAIKAANPKLPILIRESKDFSPIMIARFPGGDERSANVPGVSDEQIADILSKLVSNYSEKK
jgi:NADH dehydrogenase (ubiquinone) 1 alpha subcomplex subunit 2